MNTKSGNTPSLIYRELEKLASAKELIRAQVLVQTRAQKGDRPFVQEPRKRKLHPSATKDEKVDASSVKPRQSP